MPAAEPGGTAGPPARQLARDGYEILALGDDLNPHLSLTVGSHS